MSKVELYCGDCLEILPTLEAGSVDAIITDLPYGITACAFDVIIPFAPMWSAIKRVLKPRGVFITTASQPFTSKLVMSNLEWFKYELVWEKSIATGFLHAKNKPMPNHENILVFSPAVANHASLPKKNRMTYNPQFSKGNPWKRKTTSINTGALNHKPGNSERSFVGQTQASSGSRYPKTVLYFPGGNHNREHPSQKPVALYEYLILTYTHPGELVVDIAAGSGTTGAAAIKPGATAS